MQDLFGTCSAPFFPTISQLCSPGPAPMPQTNFPTSYAGPMPSSCLASVPSRAGSVCLASAPVHFVPPGLTLYLEGRPGPASASLRVDFVLRLSTLYYESRLCMTRADFVLFEGRLCNARADFGLRGPTLDFESRPGPASARVDFALRGADFFLYKCI